VELERESSAQDSCIDWTLANPYFSGHCTGERDQPIPDAYAIFVNNVHIFGGMQTLGYETHRM